MLTFFVLLVSMAVLDEAAQTRGPGVHHRHLRPGGIRLRHAHHQEQAHHRGARPHGPEERERHGAPQEPALGRHQHGLEFSIQQVRSGPVHQRGGFVRARRDRVDARGKTAPEPHGTGAYQHRPPPAPGRAHLESQGGIGGETTRLRDQEEVPDATWRLSLFRVLAVYRYFVDLGMDPDLLRMEGFGRFRPRYGDKTAAERRKNRSVDIVLDKRNSPGSPHWRGGRPRKRKRTGPSLYKDFVFDVREGEEAPKEKGR